MKTVVIFGGSGFIGQNVIRCLSIDGYKIIVPYQQNVNEAKLRLYGNLGQIIPIKFNSLSEDKIIRVINNADIILNLKTIWQEKKGYSYKNHILNFNINLVNRYNRTDKNKIFIFFSDLGVDELSPSKRISYIAKSENYILKNLNNASIIRPSIVIGEEDLFLRKLIPIIKFSFLIPLFGTGNTKLQPVYVDDVANAVKIILQKNIKGSHIYELGGPRVFTYLSLYQVICNCLKLKRRFIRIPFKMANICASIIEKTPFNIITKEQLLLFKKDNILSNQHRSFKDLDIVQNDVEQIIKKIIIK